MGFIWLWKPMSFLRCRYCFARKSFTYGRHVCNNIPFALMHFIVFTINCVCRSDSFSTDRLPMQATWEKIWNQLGLNCSRCRIHHTSWPSWRGCLVSQNEVGEKPSCVLCHRSYGMDETRNYRLLLRSHFARRIVLPPGIKSQVCLDIIVFLHLFLMICPFLLV